MTAFWMGFYVLMWPAMSAVVLALIWVTFTRELKQAKREGRSLV